jgi:hypothetical protein
LAGNFGIMSQPGSSSNLFHPGFIAGRKSSLTILRQGPLPGK